MNVNEVAKLYEIHFDTLYRICFLYFKQEADALDIVQDTFLKLMSHEFEEISDEKTKAWLIVTASNGCKTKLAHWWRKKRVDFDESRYERGSITFADEQERGVMQAIMNMESKYRIVTYLYYYEGYKTEEIGKLLGVNGSTVRTRLAKARQLLKMELTE